MGITSPQSSVSQIFHPLVAVRQIVWNSLEIPTQHQCKSVNATSTGTSTTAAYEGGPSRLSQKN